MKKLWNRFYAKFRADVAGSLATGGLGVGVLFVLEYLGVNTSAEEKVAITTVGGYIGGKVAAYMRYETGPIVAKPTPPPMD